MRRSITTVSLSGTLNEKLTAVANAGFDGVEIFDQDLLCSLWTLHPIVIGAGNHGERQQQHDDRTMSNHGVASRAPPRFRRQHHERSSTISTRRRYVRRRARRIGDIPLRSPKDPEAHSGFGDLHARNVIDELEESPQAVAVCTPGTRR